MTRLMMLIVTLAISCVLACATGCLGERHEKNVPAANLDLWSNGQGTDQTEGSLEGKPRYLGTAQSSGTLPARSGVRGSLPGRSGFGTLPGRGAGTTGRGSLPSRSSLPVRTGTLPRR